MDAMAPVMTRLMLSICSDPDHDLDNTDRSSVVIRMEIETPLHGRCVLPLMLMMLHTRLAGAAHERVRHVERRRRLAGAPAWDAACFSGAF